MTFTIRIRGGGGLTLREYCCPEHGVFEALVERDAVDEQPCPVPVPVIVEGAVASSVTVGGTPVYEVDDASFRPLFLPPVPCGLPSPRCFTSAPAVHTKYAISVTRGKNDAKPRPTAMDTRALAEGQPYEEWRAERKKLWEPERHKRIKELLE